MNYEITKLIAEIEEENRAYEETKKEKEFIKKGSKETEKRLHIINICVMTVACILAMLTPVLGHAIFLETAIVILCATCYGEGVYSILKKDRMMTFCYITMFLVLVIISVILYVER